MNNRRYNLFFFLADFSFGGAGKSITKLCSSLSKKKYQIHVICLSKCFYKNDLKKVGVDVIEINESKVSFAFFKFRKIIKKNLNKEYVNIIISNIHYVNIFTYLSTIGLNNFKLIFCERTSLKELKIYFNKIDFIKKCIIRFLIPFIYNKADVLITNSLAVKKSLEKKILKRKIFLNYSPTLSKIEKNKNFKINKNKLKILYTGRFSREKNVDCILKAMKILNFDYELWLIGNGERKEHLVKLSKKLNIRKKVKFINFTNDLKKYYKKSDICINSSFFEGQPNSLIEAINYNVPIIYSNIEGISKELFGKERVINSYKINDHVELGSKINDFYLKPKKYIKKTLIAKKNLKRFKINNVKSKFEKIINYL